MPGRIRLAKTDDAEAVRAIYAPHVRDGVASFETAVPRVEEMRAHIEAIGRVYPWLVYETGGAVAGYAYASRHRERAAYAWSVDLAVYVDGGQQRRGVGRALYVALIALLRRLGYYNAYGGITLPNSASVGLHEAMGFKLVGVYEKVGYKFGNWWDVGWWSLALQDQWPAQAATPLSIAKLPDDEIARLLGS